MALPPHPTPDGTDLDYAATYPLRPFALAGGLSMLVFAVGCIIMLVAVRTPELAARTDPLALYTLCVTLVWAGCVATLLIRPPEPRQSVVIWGRITNALIWSLHSAAAWLVWGVLPFLSLTQQFFIVVFLTAYVPTQIISSPENSVANRGGIVIVLGSTVAVLATRGSVEAQFLALYIGLFGMLMFVLGDKIQRTVAATVAARLASDANARELDRLLATVASERDAKTKFIATASHDLGQPLQAAALFFDQSLRAADAKSRAKAIDGVHRAFASAEQLLAHMLNHLRLEADAVEPHPSRIELAPLLKRIAAQYAPAAEQYGIRISTASTDATLMLDPVLIDRALGNLVNNAIVHSQGSRLLLVARRHGLLQIRLWVIDNGVGIGRTDARHVFEDYYQGAVPQSSVRTGFGLGLSSVRRIAEIMSGEAGLDPRWTKGSAFYLEFACIDQVHKRRRKASIRQVGALS